MDAKKFTTIVLMVLLYSQPQSYVSQTKWINEKWIIVNNVMDNFSYSDEALRIVLLKKNNNKWHRKK